MPNISDADLFECCALVYRRWAEEYDLLKKVKNEMNDGSKDWVQFHSARLSAHTKETAKWRELLDRLNDKFTPFYGG